MSDAHYPAATLPPRSQSLVPAPLNGVQHATSQPPPPPPAPAPTSDSSTRPQQPPAPTNGPETTSQASSRQNAPARHTNPWRLSEDSTVPEPHADPYAENASQPQLFPRIPPGVTTFANEDFHGVPHHILPLPYVRSETLGSSSQQRDGPPPSQVGRHRRLVVTGSIPPRSSDDDSDLDDEEVTLRFLAAHVGHDPLASAQRLTREESIRTHQLLRGAVSNRRVASKVAVANLEAVALESLPESERMCIICYNEFATVTPEGIKEVPLRLPKCKHVFGDHCIKKWFEESDSCPYCRDKVPSETQARANTRAINEIIFQNRARAAFNNAQPPAHRSTQTSGTSSFGVSAGGPAPSSGPHTGGRRSPPDDGEQRRRTRPRHSGSRASTTALMGASTAASAGASITTSPGSTAPRPISFGDFSRERMEPFFRPFEPSTSQPEGPAAQEQRPNPITEPEDTIMANTHTNRLPARVSLPGMSSLGLDAPPSTLA